MIHRAILGTLERFTAVLIEHYGGAFPLWLSPEQVRLVPVADRHVEHARGLASRMREAGLRPEVDESGETVGKKVRAAQLVKAPYVLVIGDKEIEVGTSSRSAIARGPRSRACRSTTFTEAIVEEAETRRLTQSRFGG